MLYNVVVMIEQLSNAKYGECVAYGVETQQEMHRTVFPALMIEIRRRGLTYTHTYDRITNDCGGYLLLFAERDPNCRSHLLGRQIVAGNVPEEYMRLYG